MTEPKFVVGQTVWRYDVNRKVPEPFKVVAVGRKLVQIDVHGHWTPYYIEDGRRNDNYGHSRILVQAEHDENVLRGDLLKRLRAHGLEPLHGKTIATARLQAVVTELDSEELS